MNRFFRNKKTIAFTLAEMMVILALFSTIAAATLPVITAKNTLDVDSAINGSTIEPWYANSAYNGIGYYNSYSSMANTNAVMVGGQVTEDPATIGYPQLTIKDNYGVTYNSSSGDAPCVGKHIVLLKNHGGTTYAAGSIRMGTPDIDSIAIGANTTDNKLSPSHTGAIAIGSYAMGYNKTNDIGYTSSVAIGTKAMYGNYNTSSYSVALGTESCSNTGSLNNNSVCIGNNAGNTYDNSRSVNIGSYTSNLGSSTSSVNIGTYAGVYNYGNSTVNVGYYAGRQTSKRYSVESVTIGPYAGSHNRSNMYGMVAIGSYAGFYTGSNRIYGNIYLGHMAGLNSLVSHSSTNANPSIIIGPFAGNYANTTTTNKNHFYNASPVIIGYFAGSGSFSSNTTDLASPVIIGTSAFYYDSYKNLSSRPSVVIGYMAGYNMDDSPKSIIIGNNAGNSAESLKYSICIGAHTCAYNYGNYDVRISPYGYYKDPSYGNMLRRHTSYLGYMGGLVNGGYVWNHINNYASSMSGLSYNELKYRLFNNSSIYANMYISPISRDFAQSGYEDTSIVLYADKVYGPTTEFSVLSDKRLKENIKPAKYGLKDIRKINVYEYNWKNIDIPETQIGIIAQEMKKVIPEGVYSNDKGILAINSDWLIYPMVNAVQELDKSILSVKNDLIAYVKEYAALVSRVKTLEKRVKTLEHENKSLEKDISIAYKKAKSAERQ